MMESSAFYTFLTYVQIGSIMLTFILQILGIIVCVFALRALLIYIKKNNQLKVNSAAPVESQPATEEALTAAEEAAAEAAEAGSGISLGKPQE